MEAKLLYGNLGGDVWTISLGGLIKVERGYVNKNLKARITIDPPCFYEERMARKTAAALTVAANIAKAVNEGKTADAALQAYAVDMIDLADMYMWR